jgi:hypothetical protein
MRQVLSFHLDSCDVKPVLYYDEPALRCDDDDVSVFILIHMLEKQDRGAIKIKIKNAETKHRRYTIQERHRFTWFTQCGLRPPEKLPGPFFIIIQQNEGIQPIAKPVVTSSSFSHSLLSQNTILPNLYSCNTFPS